MLSRPSFVMHRVLAALVAAPVLVAAVLVAPSVSARDLDAIAIGDSVMLGAKSQLRDRGVDVVDAAVSRQAATGPGLLRKRGGKLPEHVVVHLGTNGTYTLKMCKELVRTAGKQRRVYLVTVKVPRKWESVNNDMLRSCDGAFRSDRVVLLDWNAAATKNPSYLYADGVHLRPEGARAFARMIERAVTAPRAPYSDRLPVSVRR
ncbi:MAG: hypothetical protein O2815_06070 [Actinomycetota bacterium]|nr:hypothetical protein [Actinomycetota bacterium]